MDLTNAITVTIILDINKLHPSHYRILIRAQENKKTSGAFLVWRELVPKNRNYLDGFIEMFKKTNQFFLVPASGSQKTGKIREFDEHLSIKKSDLRIVSAWEIGPDDLAVHGIDDKIDPIVPIWINDAPIFQVLKRLSNTTTNKRKIPDND